MSSEKPITVYYSLVTTRCPEHGLHTAWILSDEREIAVGTAEATAQRLRDNGFEPIVSHGDSRRPEDDPSPRDEEYRATLRLALAIVQDRLTHYDDIPF